MLRTWFHPAAPSRAWVDRLQGQRRWEPHCLRCHLPGPQAARDNSTTGTPIEQGMSLHEVYTVAMGQQDTESRVLADISESRFGNC